MNILLATALLKDSNGAFSSEKASTVTVTLGVISGILFIVAGIMIGIDASDLTELRSQGGQTIAEIYYQQMGKYGIAYSIMSIGMGLGLIMVSIGLGSLLVRKQ